MYLEFIQKGKVRVWSLQNLGCYSNLDSQVLVGTKIYNLESGYQFEGVVFARNDCYGDGIIDAFLYV